MLSGLPVSGTEGIAGVGIIRSPGRPAERGAEGGGAETGSLMVTENNDSSFSALEAPAKLIIVTIY